jgi:hypothetical protein
MKRGGNSSAGYQHLGLGRLKWLCGPIEEELNHGHLVKLAGELDVFLGHEGETLGSERGQFEANGDEN